jgi:acyl-CoA synthetase (AMP-forming)/AMP-acid ligase II
MDLIQTLRQYAHEQPDSIAIVSRYRTVTYRKLWSRIERATARLQGEWHVGRGDRAAYCGPAHPDALMLYLALARCGARLMPLEQESLQSSLHRIAQELPVKIILHHDDTPIMDWRGSVMPRPLSALIMTRCPYDPLAIDDASAQASLELVSWSGTGPVHAMRKSMADMLASASRGPAMPCQVDAVLFDQTRLGPVLHTLLAGGTIVFN